MRTPAPWLVVTTVAACGAPVRSPAPVATSLTNTVQHALPPHDDADALSRWRGLGLTGADHDQALAALAADRPTAVVMARALLRDGGFACPDVIVSSGCGEDYRELAPLDPAATFDNPCLRRVLAQWALDQLTPHQARGLDDVLVDLVAMEAPETELQAAAFAVVGDADDALRLRLLEVAAPELAEPQAGLLRADAARIHAALDLHLRGAIDLMTADPARYRAPLRQLVGDDDLDDAARIDVVTAIAELPGADLDAALRDVADHAASCELAERAAEILADRGDPSRLPARPASHDLAAHMRALCMLDGASLDDRDARLAAWIGRRGVAVADQDYDDGYDARVDADPATADLPFTEVGDDGARIEHDGRWLWVTRQVAPADANLDHLAAVAGDASCSAATGVCRNEDAGVELELAADGPSMVIVEVRQEVQEGGGCGC